MPRVRTQEGEAARAEKAAQTRVRHLEECYGEPHRWQYIRRGFDPLGKHTKSGYLVKHYALLRCLEHPDEGEVVAGLAEAKHYGGIAVRRQKAGRPRIYRRDGA